MSTIHSAKVRLKVPFLLQRKIQNDKKHNKKNFVTQLIFIILIF